MSKLVVVCGATGQQGGSVARRLAKNTEWKVRGITRNPNGDAAKTLASDGIEVVKAESDDVESLTKAFEGATAIFGITNFWDKMPTKTQKECGEIEYQQALNIATAASKTSTLQHYIFATLPSAEKETNGQIHVAHLDYKARAVQHVLDKMPDLVKQTTWFWAGFYPSNFAFFPNMKIIEIPGSYGSHAWIVPSPASASLPISGEIENNTGIVVEAILAHPQLTQNGKYVNMTTDFRTFTDIMSIYSEVTGKRATVVPVSTDTFTSLWGHWGNELAMQFEYGAQVKEWKVEGGDFVSFEQLGVKDKMLDLRQSLERLKVAGLI